MNKRCFKYLNRFLYLKHQPYSILMKTYKLARVLSVCALSLLGTTSALAQESYIFKKKVPDLRVTSTPKFKSIKLSDSSLDFSAQSVTTSGAPRNITISNAGTLPLTITGISVATGLAYFNQSNTCKTPLGSKDTCILSVAFTPTNVGAKTGSILIANDGDSGPVEVLLEGIGVQGAMSLNPILLDPTALTQTSQKVVQITNSGSAPLHISELSLHSGAPAFEILNTTCNVAVIPSGTCALTLQFKPTNAGLSSGQLKVTSDGEPATVYIPISATAVDLNAAVTADVPSLDFAQIPVNSTVTRDITFTNNSVLPVSFTPSLPTAPFSVSNSTCATILAANTSCTITISVTPLSVESYASGYTFKVTTNEQVTPLTISLFGGSVPTITGKATKIINGTSYVQTDNNNNVYHFNGYYIQRINADNSTTSVFSRISVPLGGTCNGAYNADLIKLAVDPVSKAMYIGGRCTSNSGTGAAMLWKVTGLNTLVTLNSGWNSELYHLDAYNNQLFITLSASAGLGASKLRMTLPDKALTPYSDAFNIAAPVLYRPQNGAIYTLDGNRSIAQFTAGWVSIGPRLPLNPYDDARLTMGSDGFIYATTSSTLYKINPLNGTIVLSWAYTGLAGYPQNIAISSMGVPYVATSSGLYRID